MFPDLGMQTGGGYPTSAMVQQNTPLLGEQPTDQLRIPQMPMMPGQAPLDNQVQPQQPMQPGVTPQHVANMVQALKGPQ